MKLNWERLWMVLKKTMPGIGFLAAIILGGAVLSLIETGKSVGLLVALLWVILMSLFIIILIYIVGWDDE